MSKKSDAPRARRYDELCDRLRTEFKFAHEADINPGVALYRIPRQAYADELSKYSPTPVSLSDVYTMLGTNEAAVKTLEQSIRIRAVREALDSMIGSPSDVHDYYTSEIKTNLDAMGFEGRYGEGFESIGTSIEEIKARIEKSYPPYKEGLKQSFYDGFVKISLQCVTDGSVARP